MYLERWIPGGDKIEHAVVSAAIFIVIFQLGTYFQLNVNLYVTSFLLTLLLGALEEVRQVKIKKRECDMKDWVADFLGTCIGLLLVWFFF